MVLPGECTSGQHKLELAVTASALPVRHIEYLCRGQGRLTLAEHPHLLAGDEHLHVSLTLTQHIIPKEAGRGRVLWWLALGCGGWWVAWCEGVVVSVPSTQLSQTPQDLTKPEMIKVYDNTKSNHTEI